MTIFGRLSSLKRKLLVSNGPGGRLAAPLRAYGKLAIAEEYLEIGCDDLQTAKEFSTWVHDGINYCWRVFGNDPVHLRQHRLLLTTDRGRIWIVACLWDSRDKRSDQGHQRSYPFTLFIVVPALVRAVHLADVGVACEPIWRELEQHYEHVRTLGGRSECISWVRSRSVRVRDWSPDLAASWLGPAAAIRLRDWLATYAGPSADLEAFIAGLQHRLLQHRRGGGPEQAVWRVPLSSSLGTGAQCACWISWLSRNLGKLPQDLTVFVPQQRVGSQFDLCVILRPPEVGDFVCLSTDEERIKRGMGERLADTGRPVAGGQRLFAEVAARLPVERVSLADFARFEFPKPLTGRGE